MSYTVIQSDTQSDRQKILDLWSRNFPEACPQRFDWLYRSGRAKSWTICNAEGHTIGAAGLMDRNLQIENELVHAKQAIDLNIDRQHRTIGAALQLVKTVIDSCESSKQKATSGSPACEAYDCGQSLCDATNVEKTSEDCGCGLIYAFPNSGSEPIMRRAGYRVLGSVERWVKLLRSDAALFERWLPKGKLCKAASKSVNCLLPLFANRCMIGSCIQNKWRAKGKRSIPDPFGSGESVDDNVSTGKQRQHDLRVEVTDCFDDRFDLLWEKAAKQFPIIGQRSASYLNWRFSHLPDARHRVLCLLDKQNCLKAYLVYYCSEGSAYIGDFLFEDPFYLKVLFADFTHLMCQQGIDAIVTVFLGSSEVQQTLAQSGFYRRPSTWNALVHSESERFSSNTEQLLNSENWYITRADIDTNS